MSNGVGTVINLSNLFPGNKWFKSISAAAILVLVAGSAVVEYMGLPDVQMISAEALATYEKWILIVGNALAVVGIRRRLG